MFWSLGLPSKQSMEVNPETGGNNAENFAAGVGQSLVSTGRGIRQLWNYATGDEADLAALDAEEAEARKIDERLLGTKAGRTGQIAGHVGQILIPAAGAAKGASLLGKGIGLTRALPAIMAAEGAVGGVAGAVQPTVEGESHLQNAKEGAILGAAIPGLGAVAKPIIKTGVKIATPLTWLAKNSAPYGLVRAGQEIGNVVGGMAQKYGAKGKAAAEEAVAKALQVSKDEGKALVSQIRRNVDIPHAALGRALREHVDEWGRDVPDVLKSRINKALGDADIVRPTTVKPPKPPKPKVEKEAKPPTTKKETEGQKLKRLQAENNARDMLRVEREASEAAKRIAAMRPKVGDAARAPGEVKTVYAGGRKPPSLAEGRGPGGKLSAAQKAEAKAKALRTQLGKAPVPGESAELYAARMRRYEKGRPPDRVSYGERGNVRPFDPLEVMSARRGTKLGKKEYEAARYDARHKVPLPKDIDKGIPKPPPRVMQGPAEGPRIKGKDVDEILHIIEADTSKGLRGESMKRLRNVLEGHVEQNLTEAERKALAAARAKALKGDIPVPPFRVPTSVKRQAIREAASRK
jgi:hypothetical protein